jgi:hypothetical protein
MARHANVGDAIGADTAHRGDEEADGRLRWKALTLGDNP